VRWPAKIKPHQVDQTISLNDFMATFANITGYTLKDNEGEDFTFLGRSFMYADAALGDEGADHMMGIMKTQLHQVMDHVYCERVEDLSKHLVG